MANEVTGADTAQSGTDPVDQQATFEEAYIDAMGNLSVEILKPIIFDSVSDMQEEQAEIERELEG